MPDQPKVFISILNWDGLADTLECLESINKMDYPNYDVIVVDNDSTDKSISIIKSTYPQVILIENKENMGFSGGNNVAMKYAMEHGADYVWLLNNDTIVEKDTLAILVNFAQAEPQVGMLSPIIYDFKNRTRVQFAGSYLERTCYDIIYAQDGSTHDLHIHQEGPDVCLWGTALLIKRNVIDAIGYLNKEYFAYWEDTEYSIRALEAGIRNVLLPDAKIYHKGSKPWETVQSPHFYYYLFRNEYILKLAFLKGLQRINFKRKYIANLLYYVSSFVRHQNGHEESINAVIMGAWHGIKRAGGKMRAIPKMPWLLEAIVVLLASHPPYFWSYLIRGEFMLIFKKGSTKLFQKTPFSNVRLRSIV